VHEHIARAMYYFSVHLLYASIVGSLAWVLTSIRRASATTKYWIWVATAFNFSVPVGAVIDKLWAPRLVKRCTHPARTIDLASAKRALRDSSACRPRNVTFTFVTDGIPVSFDIRHPGGCIGIGSGSAPCAEVWIGSSRS
jgi:hypothetical protein